MRYLLRKIWKIIRRKFDIPNIPRALPMRFHKDEDLDLYTWEDWHKEAKEKYPVRHFLFHDLPIWVSVKYRIYVEDPIYWISSYLIKQDHKLNLSNSPCSSYQKVYKWGYRDPNDTLEYAVYQSFMEYVKALDGFVDSKSPKLGDGIDYKIQRIREGIYDDNIDSEELSLLTVELEYYKNIKELFIFFNKELPELYNESIDMLNTTGMNKEQRHKLYKRHNEFDHYIQQQLTENMIRVIKLRGKMWL